MAPPPDDQSLSSHPFQKAVMQNLAGVATVEKHENQTALPNKENFRKPSRNLVEAYKNLSEITPDKPSRTMGVNFLNCSKISNYYPFENSNIPVSPIFKTSVPNLKTSPEMPPVLQLYKHPVVLPFPDNISCIISKRSHRPRVRQINEPLLREPKFSRSSSKNLQRTKADSVIKTAKKLSEMAALGSE